INFGIFSYATEPFIPVLSNNLWMITHTTQIGTRTIPQNELKDGSESALNKQHNITYIINRMRTTFTKYIIIVKDPSREGDVTHRIISQYLASEYNISALFDGAQFSMFQVPDTYYIHSVQPVHTQLTVDEIYSARDGWLVYSFLKNQSDEDYELELNDVGKITSLDYPTVFEYELTSPGEIHINGNFEGEWIVVKDHYFPTWHAYMGTEELRIEESNLGTLLIKSHAGNEIILKHKPYPFEPLLSIVALIALIVSFLLPARLSSRPSGKKESYED
ncbi:hypothetical protein KY320_00885, partial [Candidatus Woesearchaeota archaeon]|nr:hypothetical protein [Candidatus Woesearchaeota archaeon]